ncbi:hypothetical protein ILUMI_12588, partial [Ignelater luminosus]
SNFISKESLYRDVLHGVTGVVQGGLNMISSTISRIVDGAGTVRDKVIRILEELRKYMQQGIPELGIPILEPLVIERIELNIASPKIGRIQGFANKVEVRGLSEFKIDYVNWDSRHRLTLNITFPRIDVNGKYGISGEISRMINIHGNGPFWLKLRGLSIGAIAQFSHDMSHDPPNYISAMRIGIKLKKINNNFSNLMNGTELGQLFNEVVSKVAPEALDMLWPEIEPGISRQVAGIINDKLKVFQLSGIIGRLLNFFTMKQGRINVHT